MSSFGTRQFDGIDLLAAGLPCPPFSVAGHQLGEDDDRNLFPALFRVIREANPRAILIENVRGIMSGKFESFRRNIIDELRGLGYWAEWNLVEASQFGVSQFRHRVLLVAFRDGAERDFSWPMPSMNLPPTVGDLLYDLMSENNWKGVNQWLRQASKVAPTIVGGSKKHGGPDLGPTRAREAWRKMGVNGAGIANEAPESDFVGLPKLTGRMVARIQDFPDEWAFYGGKTTVHRQIGNALPPSIAHAVGSQIHAALETARSAARV